MDLPDPDELLGRLSMWASEQRIEDAKRKREEQRREREMALDEMRLSGLLRDAYESQVELTVLMTNAERIRGRVVETGSDYIAVGAPGYGSTIVSISAIERIEVESVMTPSDRSLVARRTMNTALDEYAGHRIRISTTNGNGPISGELEGVGADLAVIVVDAVQKRRTFLPISSIATLAAAESA